MKKIFVTNFFLQQNAYYLYIKNEKRLFMNKKLSFYRDFFSFADVQCFGRSCAGALASPHIGCCNN